MQQDRYGDFYRTMQTTLNSVSKEFVLEPQGDIGHAFNAVQDALAVALSLVEEYVDPVKLRKQLDAATKTYDELGTYVEATF